jgi:hypothetical protein
VFGEKRTQKLSPGLIKDQHGLFYFFSRSLLSTTMTSILIQYGGRMQISKMGLILPYEVMTRYAKRKLKYSLNENFNLFPYVEWDRFVTLTGAQAE